MVFMMETIFLVDNDDESNIFFFDICMFSYILYIYSLFQLLKKSASQILNSDMGTFHNVDITSIQLALAERQSELPHTSRSGIPIILPDGESRFGSVR